jgi:hypothetical protein
MFCSTCKFLNEGINVINTSLELFCQPSTICLIAQEGGKSGDTENGCYTNNYWCTNCKSSSREYPSNGCTNRAVPTRIRPLERIFWT